jgi:hypothetical protein
MMMFRLDYGRTLLRPGKRRAERTRAEAATSLGLKAAFMFRHGLRFFSAPVMRIEPNPHCDGAPHWSFELWAHEADGPGLHGFETVEALRAWLRQAIATASPAPGCDGGR